MFKCIKRQWIFFKNFKHVVKSVKIIATGGYFPFRDAPSELINSLVEEGEEKESMGRLDDRARLIWEEAIAEKAARIRRGEWAL